MVWGSKRSFPVEALGGVFFSVYALDFVGFDSFEVGERREDVGEPFDEHGFPGSRRTDQ